MFAVLAETLRNAYRRLEGSGGEKINKNRKKHETELTGAQRNWLIRKSTFVRESFFF